MSMEQKEGWIWFDDEFVPWGQARVHVLTHTLHYGTGVFEGVRAYAAKAGTAIFRLQDHTRRLFTSADAVKIRIPFTENRINEVHREVLRKNALRSGYIRPMVFYGAEDMGLRADRLKVHVIVAAWEWGSYLGEDNMKEGIRVKTSSVIRCHSHLSLSRAKANGNYLNSMLALHEARSAGYEEALMFDSDGFVCEGSGENLFIVHGGVLHTPDLTAALDGITRRTIIELAREQKIEVYERRIELDEVYAADEAFFTGTAAEVMPIRELDERRIGNGRRGRITEKLQSAYFSIVNGRSEEHLRWLDFV